MSQAFRKPVSGETKFGQLYGLLGDSLDAVRSHFSGTAFPASPSAGQLCYRTDRGGLYLFTDSQAQGEGGWIDVSSASSLFSSTRTELTDARGTAASLEARLDVALNDDGTLKGNAPASDWWNSEPDAVAWASGSMFTVVGDKRAIYLPGRALKLTQFVSGTGHVESATYDADADRTSVVVGGITVDTDLSAVEFGQEPGNMPAHGHAVAAVDGLQASLDSKAQARFLRCNTLIGGSAGALDAIPRAGIAADDLAVAVSGGALHIYRFDATSTAAESEPAIIKPDDAGMNLGRWILQQMSALLLPAANTPPPGLIAHFASKNAPIGWLSCDGKAVERSTYTALDAAIYVGDANNATALWGYRCTDPEHASTSRDTTGAHLVLPDLRGEFIRSWSGLRPGVDANRVFGSAQAQQIQSHTHTGGAQVKTNSTKYTDNASGYASATTYTGYTGGDETRPRNMALLACIKY
ncbi:phage tail protein [Desulfocurvibacter africanus]|uniref:phage tail protein n=1 Tax=Desulfocurvibacter africanus TaxID=873 RepID=UPI00040C4FD8|nr:phage tail protein [Desulfocurvibacter africanus]